MKEFEQQSFQLHYQERQQAFEKLENQKMMNMLHAESEEIIRALRQYNDFVKEF